MVNASVVASASHAVLASYLAHAMLASAKSRARRALGIAFAFLGGYSVAIGLGYYVNREPPSDVLFCLCLVFALAGTLFLLRFVVSLASEASQRESPARAWWWVAPLAISVAVAGDGIRRARAGQSTGGDQALLGAFVLAAFLGIHGTLLTQARRGDAPRRAAARAYVLACLWPLLPIAYDIAHSLGVPNPGYKLVRSLSLLVFLYALLAAYLDHGHEPMSLRVRFVAPTLTMVLGSLLVATEVVLGRSSAVADDVGARLLFVALLASVLVIVGLPRFFQRNLLEPLEHLVGGIRQLERGNRSVSLAASYDDEIGYVTKSVNQLAVSLGDAEAAVARRIEELERKNEEIRALNEDLRHKIAARSEELAEALARAGTSAAALTPGVLIDRQYRLDRLLGSGGMGTVYVVERVRDGRKLALKTMQGTTEDAVTRFAREAQIAARLDHENLVSIVDVGAWRGMAYIVMELVDGGSLEDHRSRFGDLAWGLPLLAQVARGLVELHARGIVHRDLKPPNVLLAKTGERTAAKITDFGISRQADDPLASTFGRDFAGDARRLTATGAILGTVPYMAPELLEGARAATAAVDVFAFGLVAYEVVCAESAFQVPPILLARAGAMPAPRELPVALPAPIASILRRCLERDPGSRPSTRELLETLTASG